MTTTIFRSFAVLALLFVLWPLASANAAPFAPYFGRILSCTGNYTQDVQDANGIKIKKCSSLCDLLETGQNIAKWLMTMALYIIAPLSFVIGAAMIMLGGASPKLVSTGKQTMYGTAIALAMVLGSYVIVSTIFFLIPTSAPVNWGEFTCSPAKVPGGDLPIDYLATCGKCTADEVCTQGAAGGAAGTWQCVPAPSSTSR
jgi:hypothetical protein